MRVLADSLTSRSHWYTTADKNWHATDYALLGYVANHKTYRLRFGAEAEEELRYCAGSTVVAV